MKDGYKATRRVVEKFVELGVSHMVVGGLSSNAYIHHWSALHGTRELLDEIRASIPPID